MTTPPPHPTGQLHGLQAWLSVWLAMSRKELIIRLRYPVDFVASFATTFLIIIVLTMAGSMFAEGGYTPGSTDPLLNGLIFYGFILYLFLESTLWTIGMNIRREQRQGTFEQLYLSPASKIASLISRVTITLLWTGVLLVFAGWVMNQVMGRLPVANLPLAVLVLALSLSGTFGFGFAFSAITLRLRETTQSLATLLQFSVIVFCAPFYAFRFLPDWAQFISRLIPLSYSVDLFRSTLMNYPAGFPELAPITTELIIVILFGLLTPLVGIGWYRFEEDRARENGSLSEY